MRLIRLSQLRAHKGIRYAGLALALLLAMLAAAVVVSLTIDLGPHVRELAESRGSKQLKRPIHIGRLSIHVFRGRVEVDDFAIDGLKPADRPFFTAKHLSVSLDWSTAFSREITITSVEMTDWVMLVEKWSEVHNFPKFTSDEDEPKGPKRFTTTLRYLRASRGQFAYEDHEVPWGVVARNLDLSITNARGYHGTAAFTGGTVTIQDYVPMWANMKARFAIDGPRVHLDRIDMETDGAVTVATGDVDLAHWPEQTYQVKSRVHFPRMREIFFKHERFSLAGDGDFNGTFHLFKGGRDLSGTFASDAAGVNAYRFPRLYGSLRWTPKSFDVWDAGSRFFGGDARFSYSIKPLGEKLRPNALFDATFTNADMAAFTDFQELAGVRFAGSASGHNVLEWPLGRFAEHRGDGYLLVVPPPGSRPMPASLDRARPSAPGGGEPVEEDAEGENQPRESRQLAPVSVRGHLPIAGDLSYRIFPDRVEVDRSHFITESTHVTFEGSSEWGDRSRFAFHVTSGDWQESDRLLAGIMTDFGAPTGPVAFGGRGEFDGVMTGPFRRPRVEGAFTGEDLRAWDTEWGKGAARIVVENSYVNITDAVVRRNGSEIHAEGLFSLGYPRADRGEEIDARVRVVRRDIVSLRHAFQLDEYPVSGQLSGEFHLTGDYQRPIGFGGMTVENGVAYGEPFQKATASLRFDGSGVRLDGINLEKGGGTVTGAAFVGWNGTYSFNADGRRIPVEQIAALTYAQAPLTGLTEFGAGGSGTFELPRYDVRFRVDDLFVGEEGVGQVTGSLTFRGKELSGEVAAASPRLAITGTGRIALAPGADSEMTFRFHDSSLDPYVRLFVPRLSPFTTAVASGSIRIAGDLSNVDRLVVDGTVDTLDVRLFDYALRNAAPIRLALDQNVVRVRELEVVGEDTRLRVSGAVSLHDRRISLQGAGDANLGILQGFFRNVRGSGRAELRAAVDGPLDGPVFSGSATIVDGRVRHMLMPNSLDAIDGAIQFDARGIRLDDVSAMMGGGRVQFGGRIGLDGYLPGDLNVTIRGQDMHLRYPEGIRSTVDADLSVRGNVRAPTLGGTVTVKQAVWSRRVDAPGNVLDLVMRRAASGGGGGEPTAAIPLRYDVQILAPSTLRIDTNLVRMVANADLTLRGTYDRPVLFGHAEIERGEMTFEGRRYRVTRGAIEFTNPTRIEPFFDVEAETDVRVPGQTYRVTGSAVGTMDVLQWALRSDPPLPTTDVLALLFSDVQRSQPQAVAPELRAHSATQTQTQTDILKARATRALASPISAEVGKVVEQTFGVDTFQLTPSFVDPYNLQTSRLNPTARLTIGKRISDRAYLTFSRSLGTTLNDQIVLLEYDATERLSLILSRNEDSQTYALEFRVRHSF